MDSCTEYLVNAYPYLACQTVGRPIVPAPKIVEKIGDSGGCAAPNRIRSFNFIKKEAGKSEQKYIQSKLIEVVKERIFDPSKSVNEVAYE